MTGIFPILPPIGPGGIPFSILESIAVETYTVAGEIGRKLHGSGGSNNDAPPQNPNPAATPKPGEGAAADAATVAAQQALAKQQADQLQATVIQQMTEKADEAGKRGDQKGRDIFLSGVEQAKKLTMPQDVQALLLLSADTAEKAADNAKAVDEAAKEAKDAIDQTGEGEGSSSSSSSNGDDGYDDGSADDGYDDGDYDDEDTGTPADATAQTPMDPSSLLGALSPLTGAAQQAASAPADLAGQAASAIPAALSAIPQQQAAEPADDSRDGERSSNRDDDYDDDEDEDTGDWSDPGNQGPPDGAPTAPEGAPGATGTEGAAPDAGAVAAASSDDVPLPGDQGSVKAGNPELAKALKGIVAGGNPAEQLKANGYTVPAPGSDIAHPVDSNNVQALDVAVYQDKHIPSLGGHRIWLDGRAQPQTALPEAGFLGWARPQKAQDQQAPVAAASSPTLAAAGAGQ